MHTSNFLKDFLSTQLRIDEMATGIDHIHEFEYQEAESESGIAGGFWYCVVDDCQVTTYDNPSEDLL